MSENSSDHMFIVYVRVQEVGDRDALTLVREVRQKLQSVLEPDEAVRDYTLSPIYREVFTP